MCQHHIFSQGDDYSNDDGDIDGNNSATMFMRIMVVRIMTTMYMHDVVVTMMEVIMLLMMMVMMVMIIEDDEVSPAYFQITSYGGKLTYTLGYEIPQGSSLPVLTTKPDIVIEVSSYDLD